MTFEVEKILKHLCINTETYEIDWDKLCEKIPYFEQLKNLKSNPKWHSEDSVFEHTKMAYEWLIENREIYQPGILLPAVLLHDIGKVMCMVGPNGYLLSSGHENTLLLWSKRYCTDFPHILFRRLQHWWNITT